MCGIFAILSSRYSKDKLAAQLAAGASKLTHRGPDWSGQRILEASGRVCGIAHERLQIIDPYGGEQPISDRQGEHLLAVNGEIYNYRELLGSILLEKYDQDLTTGSDCEVIISLWKAYDGDAVKVNLALAGVFAYILWDQKREMFMMARDAIGVNPMFLGHSSTSDLLVISSEIKALQNSELSLDTIMEFPPGHYAEYQVEKGGIPEMIPWYAPDWKIKPYAEQQLAASVELESLLSGIRTGLIRAVNRRLMSDAPFGFLLSGGLDSSLVCSIAARLIQEKNEADPHRYQPFITTYSIGQVGSPDLAAAAKVAEYLKSTHHGFEFTVDQGIAAVPKVIYHLETFDVTTIRAGTPMYLLARRIKAMGTKMVLSGEGADELFGGYLYFHQAPNAREFFEETVDKVSALHSYDCRRANLATAAWGVEVRVPFLDREFVDWVMSIPPEYKMITPERPMEKWLLRKAFEGYLPDSILWRQKEQFSDGVGYTWIDGLKAQAEKAVSAGEILEADATFPVKTPTNKEAYYIRQLFEKQLPHAESWRVVPWSKSIACSTERALKWRKEWSEVDEPSGRAVVGVHQSSY